MGATRYTARFQLPELIERGEAATLSCPVYRSGAIVAPTQAGSTATVFDDAGEEVATGNVTVTNDIATFALVAADTADYEFGDGWRVEWELVISGETYRFVNDAALVRTRLYPTITDADLIRRAPALDPASSTVITTDQTYQDAIDEADVELQLRLISQGQRPWMVATPSAFRPSWLALALAIVFEGLSSRNDAYRQTAADWRQRYEDEFGKVTVRYDRDQDGAADSNEREGAKPGVVWLC